ncbi:MAG: flagellar motor switch protein FliN [Bdellovibrionota bacterium]
MQEEKKEEIIKEKSRKDNLDNCSIQDKVGTLQFFYDVNLVVSVELGRIECTLDKLIRLKKGSIIELDKLPEEPLDIRVNNKLLAQGEAVVVNDKFGVRVTQIVSPDGELDALAAVSNSAK